MLFKKIIQLLKIIIDISTNYRFHIKKTKKDPNFFLNKKSSVEFKNSINQIKDIYDIKFAIDQDWIHDLAFHTQFIGSKDDINYLHGYILYNEVRKFINSNTELKNIRILEIGTARGFSSIIMSKAIIDSKKKGEIETVDILPSNIKSYWDCYSDFEGKKTRYELLQKWNDELKNITFFNCNSKNFFKKWNADRVNICFLDGSHKYEYVNNEIINVSNNQFSGDIIILDDYNLKKFPGVVKAIKNKPFQENYITNIIGKEESDRKYVVAKKK